MRTRRPFVEFLIISLLTLSLNTQRIAIAQATALTVGAFIGQLQGLVQQLESSARALLEQGNTSAAQQQMLLAGTLQGTIRQLQDAYSHSMNETFDRLDTSQRNAFLQLQSSLGQTSKLEHQTSSDFQQVIHNTQSAANQLMDRMPLTDKSPVYFGLETRDVLASFDPNPNDITIYGYHLVDQRLGNKKPDITIAFSGKNYSVPSSLITAQFDRISVQLPPELKHQIQIDNSPCQPRRLFTLAGTTHYLGGFFNSAKTFDFGGSVSPGERLYSVHLVANGTRTTTQPVQSNFSSVSDSINVGCENAASTHVPWTAPDGAKQINPKSRWINCSNLKGQSADVATTGNISTAQGTIVGLDTVCVGAFGACAAKNCPGGGHGNLEIYGTYVLDTPVSTPFHYEQTAVHVNPTHISIPSETILTLATVDVEITRNGCSQVLDTIHISVPVEHTQIVQVTSSKGFFIATLQPGQMDLSTTGLAPDADHH